jgi:hypothetical protein
VKVEKPGERLFAVDAGGRRALHEILYVAPRRLASAQHVGEHVRVGLSVCSKAVLQQREDCTAR